MRRAFTITELLVVVTVVIVLVAIGLVSVRAVMDRRNDVVDLSNLGATLVDFHAWSADHNGQMLNVGLPGDPGAAWFYGEDATLHAQAHYYWSQSVTWPRILAEWMGAGRPHWHSSLGINTLGSEIDPSSIADPDTRYRMPSHYEYSGTLRTVADAWRVPGMGLATIEDTIPILRAVGLESVTAPSAKGCLAHSVRPGEPAQWQIGFVDGSARQHLYESLRPGAVSPRASDVNARGRPVMATLNGHNGRDI